MMKVCLKGCVQRELIKDWLRETKITSFRAWPQLIPSLLMLKYLPLQKETEVWLHLVGLQLISVLNLLTIRRDQRLPLVLLKFPHKILLLNLLIKHLEMLVQKLLNLVRYLKISNSAKAQWLLSHIVLKMGNSSLNDITKSYSHT